MISYHGTSDERALRIVGNPSNVDVSVGGGELGKGFYTTGSIAMATMWANQRFGANGVVIKFDISDERFVTLKPYILRTQERVVSIWQYLIAMDERGTFLFGYDYVYSRFATFEMESQYKFESTKAEYELNRASKLILPCVS